MNGSLRLVGPRRSIIFVVAASTLVLLIVKFNFSLWQPATGPFTDSRLENRCPKPPSKPEEPIDASLPEYNKASEESSFCADRFGRTYLDKLSEYSVNYCSAASTAQLNCFHNRIASDGRTDTFCYASASSLELSEHQYRLPCELRTLQHGEIGRRVPDLQNLVGYWYNTGPRNIFHDAIKFMDHGINLSSINPVNISILVKREGAGNLWHCLLELFSLSMTIDVLRMTIDPRTRKPYLSDEDANRTQIVILDNVEDGPYFNLWNLYAKMPTVRLKDITTQDVGDIIVPLAGASNPIWQGDWSVHSCQDSELLRVFVGRVLGTLDIKTLPQEGEVVVTFINRVEGRRLIDQDTLLEAARTRLRHVKIQSINFVGMPFKEQVQIVRNSDVLVGVHGAGLTHAMWLRPSSALAEILPHDLNYKGFRNLASLLSLNYFGAHAIRQDTRRDEWHWKDVRLEEQRFVELVSAAVKSTYNRGTRNFDIG